VLSGRARGHAKGGDGNVEALRALLVAWVCQLGLAPPCSCVLAPSWGVSWRWWAVGSGDADTSRSAGVATASRS
jgi:hypothetical protein